MAWPVRSPSPRAEFGRIYLRALVAAAKDRVELHRSKGHRLRLVLARRRLRKLLAYEAERNVPIGTSNGRPSRLALAVVSLAWIVLATLLAIAEVRAPGTSWVTILDVPTLALTVVWFWLAVTGLPAAQPTEAAVPADRRKAPRDGPMPVFEWLRASGFSAPDGGGSSPSHH
jgi:hypothetical protein